MDKAPQPAHKIVSSLLSYGQRKRKPPEKYARFNRRMLAVTIDSFILLLFLPAINQLAPINHEALMGYTIDPGDPHATQHLLRHVFTNRDFLISWFLNFLLQMLLWCVFSAVFLHFYSATPGKILLRMKVVDAKTEGSLTDRQVFLRSIGYLVSTMSLCIGFFWINVNKHRRGWHDYLAGTVVITLPVPPVTFWKKKTDVAPATQAKTADDSQGHTP